MTYRITLLAEYTKLSDMSDNFVVITGYRYRVQGTPASKSADYLRANGENKSLYYNDPYFASHDSVGAYKMTEAIKACTGYYIW